jgi:hypothetical protein
MITTDWEKLNSIALRQTSGITCPWDREDATQDALLASLRAPDACKPQAIRWAVADFLKAKGRAHRRAVGRCVYSERDGQWEPEDTADSPCASPIVLNWLHKALAELPVTITRSLGSWATGGRPAGVSKQTHWTRVKSGIRMLRRRAALERIEYA